MIKAEIGDYIRFKPDFIDPFGEKVVSKVVAVHEASLSSQVLYETECGLYVNSEEVDIEDILLPSEVEIG